MKVIKSIAVLSLSAFCLFACTSKPDLDGFRKVDISNNMLDTMPKGRLSNYKETIEKTYLLGCLVLSTAGSSSEKLSGSVERMEGGSEYARYDKADI